MKENKYLKSLSLEERQSDIISAMRLPLIFGVILIHSVFMVHKAMPDIELGVGNYIYTFVTQLLSENFLRAVVPCFFVFSGYFFFLKYSEQEWSGDFYYKSLGKRIKGLLIPFLLWNIIYYVMILLKNGAFEHFGLATDYKFALLKEHSFEYWLVNSLNAPFWYVESLLSMMLLSPIFYYIFRYLKHWGMLLITLLYLSGWESGLWGTSTTAIMFFGFGAYMGLYKKNILAFAYKLRYPALAVTLILPIIITLYLEELGAYVEQVIHFYVPFGVLSLFVLTHWICLKSEAVYNFFQKYSAMVFFIYAVNELYIMNWVKGALARVPLLSNNPYGHLLAYFLLAPVTIFVCILLYKLMKHYTPSLLAVLTGGRI